MLCYTEFRNTCPRHPRSQRVAHPLSPPPPHLVQPPEACARSDALPRIHRTRRCSMRASDATTRGPAVRAPNASRAAPATLRLMWSMPRHQGDRQRRTPVGHVAIDVLPLLIPTPHYTCRASCARRCSMHARLGRRVREGPITG
ncbi:uncharacterized protein SCHCODRAFT_02630270 [Schizophyllum commune H4-8]|uniref:uncharacterized protein n=1 Tax=Schizophyllum commune (strain H4-8 / FGSC 9210) TaxID=578458 RepID=UPI00215E2EC5|nr:uncharacterized protein SCHCODRAFT_02630270 [Schizophyllum commune H4-8]KAI5889850.1 hypothetical protein SCHCODRAFT_02630270 [Schizophyllum commune H4-8]